MSRYSVLFTGGTLSDGDAATLATRGFDVEVCAIDLDESGLRAALKGKDAYILAGVEHVTAPCLEEAGQLKVIAFFGVGYQGFIDVASVTERGIAVTNAPGANARAVAEFTVALMLDAWRSVTDLVAKTKAGVWEQPVGRNIEGKTLGVVGAGAIGSAVARISRLGLGMRVVYSGPHPKPELEAETGAVRLPLEELLSVSDVVSLHVPYSERTDRLLDGDRLSLLKPGSILVNTSESEIVDPVALRAALTEGRLAAVTMDGYYIEPVPAVADDPHGLLALPHGRVLVAPHTANATEESFQAMFAANVDSLANLLSHGDDPRVVNPEFRSHAAWLPPLGDEH
jgi:gluconate 2-dehydrogenase